ncbi:hypothetical protein JXQ70_09540 [bacterium]|nr:hypothetical protein [bacterium]
MRQATQFLVLITVSLLLCSGCASFMIAGEPLGAPSSAEAIVTFVAPHGVMMGGGGAVGLWDGENFIGQTYGGSIVQYKAAPGKHLFMGKAENWSYVSADLKPGKNYYIRVQTYIGVLQNRVALDPVQKGDEAEIEEWMKDYRVMSLDKNAAKEYIDSMLPKVKEAVTEFEKGSVKFEQLNPDDNR